MTTRPRITLPCGYCGHGIATHRNLFADQNHYWWTPRPVECPECPDRACLDPETTPQPNPR